MEGWDGVVVRGLITKVYTQNIITVNDMRNIDNNIAMIQTFFL